MGNWKSNKTMEEAKSWIDAYAQHPPKQSPGVTVILVPAYHHLSLFAGISSYAVGVQDLSPFESGAYTGEISAAMVKGMVSYALLGHSERRKHMGETDEMIASKVQRAREAGLRPIVCVSEVAQVQNLKRLMPDFADSGLLLYEPLFAVGSGTPDTPQNAGLTAKEIRNVLPVPVLYGGSVTPENVRGFVETEQLSGVGVGGASLDAGKFRALIEAAASS